MMKTGSLFSNSIVIHFIDFFRSHDDGYQLNIEVLDNPNYEQTIIHSTLSNSNCQYTDLPVGMPSTMTSDLQINNSSGGVPSFIYQDDDVQIEGVYSLADDEQIRESL